MAWFEVQGSPWNLGFYVSFFRNQGIRNLSGERSRWPIFESGLSRLEPFVKNSARLNGKRYFQGYLPGVSEPRAPDQGWSGSWDFISDRSCQIASIFWIRNLVHSGKWTAQHEKGLDFANPSLRMVGEWNRRWGNLVRADCVIEKGPNLCNLFMRQRSWISPRFEKTEKIWASSYTYLSLHVCGVANRRWLHVYTDAE
jgi:hypothetical protein